VLKSSGMPDKIIGEIPASGLIFKDIVKVPHPSRALLGLSLVLSLVLSLSLSLSLSQSQA